MDIKKNIEEEIRKRARSYTPEWRFDTEHPDIGSALALVFAEMTARTAEQFSKLPRKNRIAFLNALGAEPLPAAQAQGYVQFTLINEEAPGVMVEAGTTVSADAVEQTDAPVDFETCEDVFVIPAEISDIYQTCDMQDTIFQIYDRESMDFQPFPLFASRHRNLQSHEMYLCHDVLFAICSEAVISLTCFTPGNRHMAPEDVSRLADGKHAVFEYYSEEGWVPFDDMQAKEGRLDLYKAREQKAFAKTVVGERESYWIRLRVLSFPAFSNMQLAGVKMSVQNRGKIPDTIYGAQEECNPVRFLPFGEQLGLYQEVYFGSEEVLSKRGAGITLSYRIDFRKIPLGLYEKQLINWEWIMEQGQMETECEYEIGIESVLWEYFNGSGWTRLFADESYSRAFSLSGEGEGHYRTLTFTCPQDMEKTLVNATETYYIRARIMKISNLYKMTGNYLVPVIENASLQYTYAQHETGAQEYVFHNNLEYVTRQGGIPGKNMVFSPFPQTGEEGMAMYIGFAADVAGSPVKMLFCMGGDMDCSRRPLLWEYWNGTSWKKLHPADETEHLSKTGTVTFSSNGDMKQKRLFGKERFWLRILDLERGYTLPERQQSRPMIRGIYMNTVPVQCVSEREGGLSQREPAGGARGNLPAGTSWRMERSIGYIHAVTNPLAMTGGCDAETPEDAMARFSGSIRHQYRAVSARDYEQLVLCAVRGIRMVKCFAGYDDTGKPLKGAVTLVVLPEQSGQQGMPFAPLREKIMQYMKGHISSSLADSRKFFVIPPERIEVRLYIECVAEKRNQMFRIKKEMLERLEVFFCPWDRQSGQGWEIGSFPSNMQIQNAIKDIPGMVYIRNIMMSVYTSGSGGQQEADVEEVRRRKYILPVNGRHEIRVVI